MLLQAWCSVIRNDSDAAILVIFQIAYHNFWSFLPRISSDPTTGLRCHLLDYGTVHNEDNHFYAIFSVGQERLPNL